VLGTIHGTFFHFFTFSNNNSHQNIPTFFTFYITSIIFYYYSNKKINYNTNLLISKLTTHYPVMLCSLPNNPNCYTKRKQIYSPHQIINKLSRIHLISLSHVNYPLLRYRHLPRIDLHSSLGLNELTHRFVLFLSKKKKKTIFNLTFFNLWLVSDWF
jgi:hypothetical protein